METLQEKIRRVVQENVSIAPYNPAWVRLFEAEKAHLFACLPNELIVRIEHFGSTAVPNLFAKPIVDMLVEVTSLEDTREKVAPVLEAQGYDYFWRPTWGEDTPPYYAWFIKRDPQGQRTHHIHMVEGDFQHWDRLLFRDYLIAHPSVAEAYNELKLRLADLYPNDRVAYTKGKTAFIVDITTLAKVYYGKGLSEQH